jgi:cytochrome P450 family 110
MSEEAATQPIPAPPHSAWLQTAIAAVRRSLDYPDRFGERYADIAQVRLLVPRRPGEQARWPLTTGTVVLVSAPDLLRELFAQSGPALAGGAPRQFAEWFFGADSLLVLDDERHRRERGALLSLFPADRIAHAVTTAREVAAAALARLPSVGTVRLGAILDDVILGIAVRLMVGPVDEGTDRRLRRSVLDGLASQGWAWPFLLFPWLRRDLGRWSPGGRAAALMADFRVLLADQVRRIRSGHGCPESWLSQLLALETRERDDEAAADRRAARVLTIFAGMVTVAVALRWCLHHLLDRPDVLARARDEAHAGATAYLDAVCKETMRIHPAIPVLARLVTSATRLGPHRLEAGTYVLGCIYLTHRRPELYPEPKRFRPERFLERSFSPYEYLPFGGGVRRCLGQGIALPQMSAVLGELVRAFDLESARRSRTRVQRRAVYMVPTDSLRASVRRAGPRFSDGR